MNFRSVNLPLFAVGKPKISYKTIKTIIEKNINQTLS